jgi:hypothetical protein
LSKAQIYKKAFSRLAGYNHKDHNQANQDFHDLNHYNLHNCIAAISRRRVAQQHPVILLIAGIQ